MAGLLGPDSLNSSAQNWLHTQTTDGCRDAQSHCMNFATKKIQKEKCLPIQPKQKYMYNAHTQSRSAKEKVYSVNCGHILDILSIIAHSFIISLCVQWRLCTCLLDLALCVTCCCVKFWVYFQELQEFMSLAVFRSKCFFLRYSQRVLYAIIFRFQKWPSKPRDLCNYGSALLPN